jgi:hypothetical protein
VGSKELYIVWSEYVNLGTVHAALIVYPEFANAASATAF